MLDELARTSISHALKGNWQEALDANLKLLEVTPDDPAALMRTAKAYFELGKIRKAQTYAKKVLSLEPAHPIALNCLEKWKNLDSEALKQSADFKGNQTVFIESPGKTKVVSLIHLSDPRMLATVECGHRAQLVANSRQVTVTTSTDTYIGRLPDDLSMRLINLMKQGNNYQAHVKSATTTEVKIFIEETRRARTLAHIDSFPVDATTYSPLSDI